MLEQAWFWFSECTGLSCGADERADECGVATIDTLFFLHYKYDPVVPLTCWISLVYHPHGEIENN